MPLLFVIKAVVAVASESSKTQGNLKSDPAFCIFIGLEARRKGKAQIISGAKVSDLSSATQMAASAVPEAKWRAQVLTSEKNDFGNLLGFRVLKCIIQQSPVLPVIKRFKSDLKAVLHRGRVWPIHHAVEIHRKVALSSGKVAVASQGVIPNPDTVSDVAGFHPQRTRSDGLYGRACGEMSVIARESGAGEEVR
ncbi:hypothetical protein ACL7TT_12495 [Microbulbifer sp. 2304DJ12-6]|uniref:hypothetical protein n=1 Tax=Microbulbifer sp. 2304DJ12-6 TaxID=3233340 RepID=UPI0039AFB9D8